MNKFIIKFKGYEFCKGAYKTSDDKLRRSEVSEEQLLTAKGQSKKFYVRDTFGDLLPCHATIVAVEFGKYDNVIYSVEYEGDFPRHYAPTPGSICSDREGIYWPVSTSRVSE